MNNIYNSLYDFLLIIYRSLNSIIRKSSLLAMKELHDKSDENLTFLKTKNIIPFYYNFLKDKDNEIQKVNTLTYY